MAPTASTGSLHVTADVDGRVVWYTIQVIGSGSDADTPVKCARFSEMHRMDKALRSEVPWFPGRFPPKTCATSWRRKTSAAFVEARRKELQMYLRLVASHSSAKSSKAWRNFFPDGSDSDDIKTQISSFKSVKSTGSLNRSFGTMDLQALCGRENADVDEDSLEESNGELGVMIARADSKG